MTVLPDDLLLRIRERAPRYDQENSFCDEDLVELATSGYLTAPVPVELGGAGLNLTELSRAQRLLAAHAPSTALAVNMHLLWLSVARVLADRGDHRLDWVFREAASGEVFAFGISEAGNESVLLDSFSSAVSDGDDFLVSGKKIFTTLSPVWTRLGLHAKVGEDSGDARIVVGFVRRDQQSGNEGITHPDGWDPLGMRATQSWNTRLERVRLRGDDVVATYEPYDASDGIILAVSLAFGVLTSSVYAGIADRALELAAQAVNLDDPDGSSRLTRAILAHRTSIDALERIAGDVDRGVARDDYSLAIAHMKNLVTDEARDAVEVAIRLVGSRAYAADSELARLYRDVLAGMFHPRSAKSLTAQVRSQLSQ